MSINLCDTIDDPYCRYKMPRITLKHEGRGNGVKTLLKNLQDVSNSLHRNADDILAYLAAELSVCSLHKNNDYIINGTFSENVVQDIITAFVRTHVLCNECKNPETSFSLGKAKKKDETLFKDCMACGAKTRVRDHKINKRILQTLASSTSKQLYSSSQ